MYGLLRQLLFRVDSETVHEWVVRATHLFEPVLRLLPPADDPVEVAGISFLNRVGLAAGFDKNARWIRVAEALGFGHVEVGAVTPRPQPGHPRPRLFRLPEHKALRNRMGFNNDGLEVIKARLQNARPRRIRVGVNLGKNADTPLENAADDYQQVMDGLWHSCDYFSLNISSPNTEGLRSLAQVDTLQALLAQLKPQRPLFLKLSPDEELETYQAIGARARDWGLAGIVFSNTTARREGPLRSVDSLGGISGAPLLERNLDLLRRVQWSVPLIGVGGICSGMDAMRYLQAGAELVQIYTGLIYAGPSLPRHLVRVMKGCP
ncbi:MAG: quinone-dependent dihydroorotate dehydrogenase [Candidatus Eremiobacteraeota bacterium]|nr:quinone-dependent dihydroorotate dehydrogenase [Candidatus Eremiobacteraeota bacterium]MCW5866642.1 quinone-dependent dihydroorotate dehydrogenase [Candidatus Eremiobacteraeota bacterium]